MTDTNKHTNDRRISKHRIKHADRRRNEYTYHCNKTTFLNTNINDSDRVLLVSIFHMIGLVVLCLILVIPTAYDVYPDIKIICFLMLITVYLSEYHYTHMITWLKERKLNTSRDICESRKLLEPVTTSGTVFCIRDKGFIVVIVDNAPYYIDKELVTFDYTNNDPHIVLTYKVIPHNARLFENILGIDEKKLVKVTIYTQK